jgi:predicted transcriptional regulator
MDLQKPVRTLMSINFVWISNTKKIRDAAELFYREKVSFLPVLAEKTMELIGVVEFQSLIKLCSEGKLDENVSSALITEFPIVNPDDSLQKLIEQMIRYKKWYALVVSKSNPKKLLGVVSLADLLLEIPELRELGLALVDLSRKIKVESDEEL